MADGLARLAAEQLLAVEPDVAARLRRERRALAEARQSLDRRTLNLSGAHEMLERTHRDIESRTSPEVERLRAVVVELEQRLVLGRAQASSIAKHLRTLNGKGYDTESNPLVTGADGLRERLDAVRSALSDAGIGFVGSDLEVEP